MLPPLDAPAARRTRRSALPPLDAPAARCTRRLMHPPCDAPAARRTNRLCLSAPRLCCPLIFCCTDSLSRTLSRFLSLHAASSASPCRTVPRTNYSHSPCHAIPVRTILTRPAALPPHAQNGRRVPDRIHGNRFSLVLNLRQISLSAALFSCARQSRQMQ